LIVWYALARPLVLHAQEAKTEQPPTEKAEPAEKTPPDTPAEPQEPKAAAPEAKPAAASDTAAETSPPGGSKSLLGWVYEAEGIFFFPQLGISFLLVGMIVLFAMQMRERQFTPPDFVRQFESLVKEKKYNDAYELARKDESFVGKMLGAGLAKISVGYPQAIEAMEEVAEDENMRHDHRLSYLSMLANVATMVGLLGTVWGMVGSFRVIAASVVAPKPNELATGVSQALVTTVWGLLQAIPAIIAYTILRNRVARMGFEAGMIGEQLMARLAGAARQPAPRTNP
jgi:biopolymer transport protein ExbB